MSKTHSLTYSSSPLVTNRNRFTTLTTVVAAAPPTEVAEKKEEDETTTVAPCTAEDHEAR